jgi:plasmid stabilization system protein ParE
LPIHLNLVEATMERIAENPNAPGSKAREDLASGCRTFHSGKHVVIYRKNGDTAEIARILHQSMDFSQPSVRKPFSKHSFS